MLTMLALLASAGLVLLCWLAYGRLAASGGGRVTIMVSAAGSGAELEQTLRGLLWLRSAGLLNAEITLEDEGLTPEGRERAERLLDGLAGVSLTTARG